MEEIKYYPKEISPIINGKSTLSANCMFFPLTEENIKNGSKPYDIHSNFSRVVITIIDYSDQNNKKTAKANIPAKRRINSLYRGTCLAADMCRQHKWSGTASQKQEEEKKNPAYTVNSRQGHKIKFGFVSYARELEFLSISYERTAICEQDVRRSCSRAMDGTCATFAGSFQ